MSFTQGNVTFYNATLHTRLTFLWYNPYDYVPIDWVCALMLSLFALSGIIHTFQAAGYHLWFLLPTIVLGDLAEVVGWSGRFWSSKAVDTLEPFLMQITTTIIAPTLIIAANFMILGQLVNRLGPQYSRLSPKWYVIAFAVCDTIALAAQAAGGADVSQAIKNHTDHNRGVYIMLGGIAFLLAIIVVYMMLAMEFIWRYTYKRPVRQLSADRMYGLHEMTGRYRLMLSALAFNTLCILTRSIYRTVQLADGWYGKIAARQLLFNICDGGMMVLASYSMNFFHPGLLMGNATGWSWTRHPAPQEPDIEQIGSSIHVDETKLPSQPASPAWPDTERVGSGIQVDQPNPPIQLYPEWQDVEQSGGDFSDQRLPSQACPELQVSSR